MNILGAIAEFIFLIFKQIFLVITYLLYMIFQHKND